MCVMRVMETCKLLRTKDLQEPFRRGACVMDSSSFNFMASWFIYKCVSYWNASLCDTQQSGMLSRFGRQDRVSTAHGRPVQQYLCTWSSRHFLTDRFGRGDRDDPCIHRPDDQDDYADCAHLRGKAAHEF
jgi:hypothetical protein